MDTVIYALSIAAAPGAYLFGWWWRGRADNSPTCTFRHRWSKWEAPKQLTATDGAAAVGQRRQCNRCEAVDYRRVLIHD